MKKLLQYKFLIIIILIAALLRFWQLGSIPPSPDWDEAALGYNAYSILKTGRDEYGTWFPLTLRSYDDYKPPLYVYLAIPSIAAFGLSVWSVRLPSVILGILAVAGTYFLIKELFKKWGKDNEIIAYASAFMLAISPWHIQFSRIAFEANVGVTLNVFGLLFFLRGLRTKYFLWFSAFIFGLALYAYHSERIFVPLLVFILFLLHRKKLLEDIKTSLIAVVIGVLTVAPLIPVFFNQNTLMRLRGTSSLADQTGLLARSVKKLEDDRVSHNYIGMVFDNRRIVWLQTVLSGYLSHYSFNWLFINGDNPRHHAPDMGMLYLAELPLLLLGMFAVARRRDATSVILFGWLVIAPIAASPTTELPHAIRTLVFLPSFQIFSAVGFFVLIAWLRKKNYFLLGVTLYLLFFAFNFFYYLHMYFVHMNPEISEYWQYGYAQAVRYAQDNKFKYKKIVVSTKLEQPHMFFLFYLRYDPRKYLQEGGTASGGFAEVRNKFDIYEFRPIHWETEIRDGSILYIGLPREVPDSIHTIKYLDGTDAMHISDR